MDGLERHLIDVDGATLEVFLAGAGEPVICRSHPFAPIPADSTWPWDATMGRLVAVNPRGVGGSSGGSTPRDLTLAQQAQDLEAVRRALGVERWVLWGESGGAALMLLAALATPQALLGLIVGFNGASGPRILEDARSVLSPHYPAYQAHLAAMDEISASPHPAVLGTLDSRLAHATWVPLGDQWLLREGDRALAVCPEGDDPRVWAAFEQFATSFDVQERLGEIRVPTLVVAGRHDPLMPLVSVEQLAVGLPHAEFVVLEESGHVDAEPGSADGKHYQAAIRRLLARLPGVETH